MIRLLRVIFFCSGILTLLIAIFFSLIYYLASNSIPKYQQKLMSSWINTSLTISRDSYAIPYIESTNDSDSFFALGYAHAQDRLWQMILLRRIAQGRLSEILGRSSLESDSLMRTLGIYNSAQKSFKKQNVNTTALLNSYSAGINFYIKQITTNGLGRGSPEFFLFTSKISPWRPVDSIALLKLIAFQSSNKAQVEILRTQLQLEKIDFERIKDLFLEPPLVNAQKNQTISYLRKDKHEFSLNKAKNLSSKNLSLFNKNKIITDGLSASNIFAVMPFRSATGFTLAASDPHGALTVPSNFMLVNLELESGTVIGGTIPGIPAVLIGRGRNIAWGMSNANIDDQDLFIEKINPDNETQYFTEKSQNLFKTRTEIIKIKDEQSITLEVKSTRNGPVLSQNLLGVSVIRPKGHEIAINWTGLSEDDRSIESLISLMKSQSINQAKKALPLLNTPGQNVLLVDSKNIGIFTAGAIPRRDISHSTRGKIPALGWRESNSWQGTLPFKWNPKTQNPKSGIVVNTNNKTTNADFPHHVSYDWGDSQRIIRANNLLQKRKFHTVSSFKEIQTDTISISAKILIPLLAKNLWFGQAENKELKLETFEKNALKILAEWNGNMNQNNPEPLIFVSWLREFQRMIMIDELGGLYKKMSAIRPLFLERVLRNKKGAAEWCDIVQTSTKETCDLIAKRTLVIAIKKLKAQFGSKITDWRWGEPHLAIHKAHIIGSWPVLSFFTNIVQEISGGDNTLMMSRMLNTQNDYYLATHGSTLRAIYDFSNSETTSFVISTGQSGHFLSRHYDDQSILWQKEQYIPINYKIKARRGGSIATTTFDPIFTTN